MAPLPASPRKSGGRSLVRVESEALSRNGPVSLPDGRVCGGGGTRTSARSRNGERPRTRFALRVRSEQTIPRPSRASGSPFANGGSAVGAGAGNTSWRDTSSTFYCPALRLAVEVDGEIHERQQEQDALRDEDLSGLGCVVLRVRNDEVLAAGQDVTNRILALCQRIADSQTPPPGFSGGGREGGQRRWAGLFSREMRPMLRTEVRGSRMQSPLRGLRLSKGARFAGFSFCCPGIHA